MSEKGNQAVKTVSFMMLITLLGKILGMVREQLLAANYGTDMQAAAFLLASRIPRTFFDVIFASAISFCKLYSGFRGIFAEEGTGGGVCACKPLYHNDFHRHDFDDATWHGVCKAAHAVDCARLRCGYGNAVRWAFADAFPDHALYGGGVLVCGHFAVVG